MTRSRDPDVQHDAMRIRAADVRLVSHPILLGCEPGKGSITLTPVLRDGAVRTLDVRCSCGGHLAVECIYPESPGSSPSEGRGDVENRG